jgi:WD40 repeat protein
VRILALDSGDVRVIRSLPGAQALAFDPASARLVVGMGGGEAPAVIDLTDDGAGETLLEYRPGGFGVTDVVWSTDGHSIATSADDGSARVFDAAEGTQQLVIPGHGAYVSAIDWSPDSLRVATSSADGTAKIWGLLEGGGRPLMTLSSQDTRAGVSDISFSPDGTKIAVTGGARSAVTIWDIGLSGDAEIANLPAAAFGFNAAEFDREGTHLYTTGAGGAVNVWDAQSLDPVGSLGGDRSATVPPSMIPGVPLTSFGDVTHIAASPDGGLVATLADQGGVTGEGVVPVWDTATGDLQFAAQVGSFANYAAWSPDGWTLAIAGGDGGDGSVTVVDRSGETLSEIMVPGLRVGSLAFMPDGEHILATIESFGSYDPRVGAVVVWNWRTGLETKRIQTQAWYAVPGPADGQIVTAPHPGSALQDLTVWDLDQERPELTLVGQSGIVNFVAVDPTGSRVAAAGGDGSVMVWDATDGNPMLVLRGHTGFASYVAFSSDGSRLASAGVDGTVRIWALDRAELVELATTALTRDLTDAECREFLHTERCTSR